MYDSRLYEATSLTYQRPQALLEPAGRRWNIEISLSFMSALEPYSV